MSELNTTQLKNEIARITKQYYGVPDEHEPTYEERLDQLGEEELISLLVSSGLGSVVLETIIKTFTTRYNNLIKECNDLDAVIKELSLSINPRHAADVTEMRGQLSGMPNLIANFFYGNLDQNYDYSKILKEIVRFNSIEL